MNNSGIYQILNLANNKFYVGSANNINRRWIEHRKLLRGKRHPNKYLQAAWNKYSEQLFEFIIIECCEDEKLIEREQYWIDLLKPYDRIVGYNLRKKAESNLGIKFSDEFKAKRVQIQTGKKCSDETKAKMSWAHFLRKRPANIGALISAAKKGKGVGRKMSLSVRENMKIAQQKRRLNERLSTTIQNSKLEAV